MQMWNINICPILRDTMCHSSWDNTFVFSVRSPISVSVAPNIHIVFNYAVKYINSNLLRPWQTLESLSFVQFTLGK